MFLVAGIVLLFDFDEIFADTVLYALYCIVPVGILYILRGPCRHMYSTVHTEKLL
jgi:hypothetical protein